jgi:hypothetical protein
MTVENNRESRANQRTPYKQPQEDPDNKIRWESDNPVLKANRDTDQFGWLEREEEGVLIRERPEKAEGDAT